MPKQYESTGSNGIFSTNGGLLQLRTDLWAREMPYWQKFMETGSYFDEFGTVVLSAAAPQSSFFNFLRGLASKEKALLSVPDERAGNRKREEPYSLSTGAIAERNHGEPASIRESSLPAPIYGIAYTLPEEMSARYGQEAVSPMENTAVYQSYSASYLNQQINEYRYQTQYVQLENHLHPAAIAVADEKKKKTSGQNMMRENSLSQKLPMAANAEAAERDIWGNNMKPMVAGSNSGKNPAAVWQPMSSAISSPQTSYSSLAENRSDWPALCSLLRQSVAETFTELLQNMIPETEGR